MTFLVILYKVRSEVRRDQHVRVVGTGGQVVEVGDILNRIKVVGVKAVAKLYEAHQSSLFS